jgi:uncharacterized membrane protein
VKDHGQRSGPQDGLDAKEEAMKVILMLMAVVGLGVLAAILAIVLLILFLSFVGWVVITFRSATRKEQERVGRSPVRRQVEQEQT